MTVSKAFKVGEGRKISKQELAKVGQPQSETGVKVILPFCDPVNATGLLKKASTRPPGDQSKQTVVSPTNDGSELLVVAKYPSSLLGTNCAHWC